MLDLSRSEEFQFSSSSISGSDQSDLFGDKSFGPHHMYCDPIRDNLDAPPTQENKSSSAQNVKEDAAD